MESSPTVFYVSFPKFLPPLTSIDFFPPSSILLSSPPFHYLYNLLNSSVSMLTPSTSILSDLPPIGWNGRWEKIGQGIIIFESFLKERTITNVISYREGQGEKIPFFIDDIVNWSDSYFLYGGENRLLKKQKAEQKENEHPYQIKGFENKDSNDKENLNEILIFLKIFESQILLLELFLNNGTHKIIRHPKKISPDFLPVYSELWEYKKRTVLEIWGNSNQSPKLFLFEFEEKEEGGLKKESSKEEQDKIWEEFNLLLMTNVFHDKTSDGLLLKKSRSNIERGKLKTILILKNEKCLKAIFYELFIQDLNKITTNISRSIIFEEIVDLRKEYLICFSNLNNFFVLHKSKRSSLSKREEEEEENLTQIKLQIFRDIPEKHVFQAFLLEKTGLFEKFGEFICSEIIKY